MPLITNVTGWNQLVNGSITGAAWTMYDNSTGGYFAIICFVVLTTVLYMRTKSPPLIIMIQILFLILFSTYFQGIGLTLAVTITTLMLALWLYDILAKR